MTRLIFCQICFMMNILISNKSEQSTFYARCFMYWNWKKTCIIEMEMSFDELWFHQKVVRMTTFSANNDEPEGLLIWNYQLSLHMRFHMKFIFHNCAFMKNQDVSMMTSSNGNISALLAICAGNSPVPGEFPTQWPVARSFDVFFDLRLNKRLSKQSWG